ncbi:prephenate/arogenate dehydrogenase family protein [Beijerinckia mobilis]|uniref:prephenate/arogenate dehydrogenase family protein n=1 Tax=Beijerinckia mobilis TaxID=231434 RepID=UPI000555F7D7|nr:prephenate/arogenate dehydrogenase family protein [Beijerinckia mobilis]
MTDGLGPRLETPLFEQVTLIGIGLIGSSLARVTQRKGLATRIVAYDSDPDVRAQVERLGLADVVAPSAEKAVQNADLVLLCAPVGAMGAIAKTIAPHLAPGTIVSDVGSVKAAVIQSVASRLPENVHFVPAHPVAGTEYSGPAAGFATLFLNRWCILTPTPEIDAQALARITAFWTAAGANVEMMKATHHDLVLAITSHVPHLIAYNIVGTAADLETVTQSEVIKFSAGGFRDFTRIASSDPTMWRDIFLNNKPAVIEMLGRFTEDLIALQRMIRHDDGEGLFNLFTRTRAIRRTIIEQGQETAAPDFGRRQPEDTE